VSRRRMGWITDAQKNDIATGIATAAIVGRNNTP